MTNFKQMPGIWIYFTRAEHNYNSFLHSRSNATPLHVHSIVLRVVSKPGYLAVLCPRWWRQKRDKVFSQNCIHSRGREDVGTLVFACTL